MLLAVRVHIEKYMHMTVAEMFAMQEELKADAKLDDFLLYMVMLSRSFEQWTAPKVIDKDIPKDLAEFIVRGRLKKACENGERLDDAVMQIINTDVNNRFYTLVKSKII